MLKSAKNCVEGREEEEECWINEGKSGFLALLCHGPVSAGSKCLCLREPLGKVALEL